MQNLLHKLLILRTPGIGPVKYRTLCEIFGTIENVVQSLNHSDEFIDMVYREVDNAKRLGIEYICDDDVRYPKNLYEIKNHPVVITVRGNINTLAQPSVSMVGTRHATGAGMGFMSDVAHQFADNGYAVVSGMAMGTDTAAHIGALRAKSDMATIAVLAGGADYIWPLENESLYHKICERGCIVSDMPVGFVPMPSNFIQRNRTIARLGDILILGEADIKSGSMTTARFANEYKKQVFAIPSHPSDMRSIGPNSLIRDGVATLFNGADDFFGKLPDKKIRSKKYESDILDRLGTNPLSESVLAELVKKSVAEIKHDLVILELDGKVVKQNGGYVKL
jgi:DNA processing protein